jgi:hypothetical protein
VAAYVGETVAAYVGETVAAYVGETVAAYVGETVAAYRAQSLGPLRGRQRVRTRNRHIAPRCLLRVWPFVFIYVSRPSPVAVSDTKPNHEISKFSRGRNVARVRFGSDRGRVSCGVRRGFAHRSA